MKGVIQSANNRLRIDVRLVDTQSGFNVWQDALDRDFYDVLELQSEVASQVVRNMQAVLADTATTLPAMDVSTVPEAYDSYLVGMHEFRNMVDRERTGDWVDRAIEHLQRAVDADPEFALAYAKLARVNLLFLYTIRAEYFDESIATARRLVERALVLEPDLDVAYTALGHIYFLENDAVAREQAIRRALELNPGNSEALLNLADLLWRKGRLHEAQEFVRAAAVRDPLNASAVALNADLDAKLGDYPAAREQLLALMRNTPDNPPYRALTQLERQFGHFDEAARWVRQNYLRHPDDVFASMDANRAAFDLGAQDLAENWMRTLASGPVDYMIPQRIQVLLNRRADGRGHPSDQHTDRRDLHTG